MEVSFLETNLGLASTYSLTISELIIFFFLYYRNFTQFLANITNQKYKIYDVKWWNKAKCEIKKDVFYEYIFGFYFVKNSEIKHNAPDN